MNLRELTRLGELVATNRWDAFDDVRPDGKTMVDILVKFMSPLETVERDIVTTILEDYLVISEYQREVVAILTEIVSRAKGKAIIISAVKDFGANKVKSGAALTFDFNSSIQYFPDQKFVFSEDPSSPRFQKFVGFKVLVDDFIGTGNQFKEMGQKLEDLGHSSEVDLVAAIVIQEQGKVALEQAGYKVFAVHERPMSIQDLINKTGKNAADVYKVYDGIEAKIACSDEYKRGYGGSEAAVTLKKTPNNTLPIFWYQGINNWPAPFPRPRS